MHINGFNQRALRHQARKIELNKITLQHIPNLNIIINILEVPPLFTSQRGRGRTLELSFNQPFVQLQFGGRRLGLATVTT